MIRCLSFLFILILAVSVQAQTTGKIAGNVLDKNTGEALAGANVYLEGTALGASTDVNGDFFIINIPPGNYTVIFSMIGYERVKMELRVSVNRTSNASVEINQAVIEGQEIIVVADKISMKRDQTSSIRNVASEDMEILPIENTSGIVGMQPGVVDGHMRGGRDNETAYMIDGMSVYNGVNRDQMISIDPDALQEVEIITGTYSAKYGEAMGGIVNMVTKEGGNEFHGKAEAFLENYYTSHTKEFVGLDAADIDRNRDYKFYIDGPVFKDKLTFFISARMQDFLRHLNGVRRFNITDEPDYSYEAFQDPLNWDQDGNYLLNDNSGDNKYVPMNWYQGYNLTGKLTFKLPKLKMSVMGVMNNSEEQNYQHINKYKPDGRNTLHYKKYMLTYQLNHFISNSAFYEFKLSYANSYYGSYLYENPEDLRYINERYHANNGYTGFYTGGQDKGHEENTTEKYLGRFDLVWQINKKNNLTAGVEGSFYTFDQAYYDIRNKYEFSDLLSQFIYEPVIISDTSSIYSDVYYQEPLQFAGYISDKMEFEDMVLELGARVEYFDPRTTYPSNYRNPGNVSSKETADERQTVYLDADPQLNFAPRLGFSYQLGESALLRFSYGHFFQYPPYNTMYKNHLYVIDATNYNSQVGNPQVIPEKTVTYEIGLWQLLNQYMDFEIALWYKDIYELSTVSVWTTFDNHRYGLYDNKDYGNARGLEVKFNTRFGRLYSELNYTLQYTRGNADNPTFTFTREGSQQDPIPTLISMPWDQRHTFNATVGYNTENYGVTMTGYYGSGTAYTWLPLSQSTLNRVNLFPNNSYKPANYKIDLRAFYDIPIGHDLNLHFTLYIYNLLDKLNEKSVNSNTGRANQAIIRESDLLGHYSDFNSYKDRIVNPANWSAPRSIKLGMGITF